MLRVTPGKSPPGPAARLRAALREHDYAVATGGREPADAAARYLGECLAVLDLPPAAGRAAVARLLELHDTYTEGSAHAG